LGAGGARVIFIYIPFNVMPRKSIKQKYLTTLGLVLLLLIVALMFWIVLVGDRPRPGSTIVYPIEQEPESID
jgi:hypothetical protein